MELRAIDMRYNLDIIGNKILDYREDELKEEVENDGVKDKEELMYFLSCRGCPQEISEERFSNSCGHFDSECEECWKQTPYEYKEWVDEDED